MRYPAIVVIVVGGIFLLAWLVSGRRIPVLVHAGAVFAVLATIAFLLWLHSGGKVIEPVAWIAVILMPVLVYVTFAFTHAMHSAEKTDGKVRDVMPQSPASAPLEHWLPTGLPDPLTPEELVRAATVQIWMVHWQLPDTDWDAYCLSVEEAQRLFQAKQDDHLIMYWGRVFQREPQTLLAWYEERLTWTVSVRESYHRTTREILHREDRERYHRIAREILRRAEAGVREPVIILA